jgi:hypothetical protein
LDALKGEGGKENETRRSGERIPEGGGLGDEVGDEDAR